MNWLKFSGFGDIFIGQTNNETVRRKSLLITDTIMLSRSSYFIEKLLGFRNISKVNMLNVNCIFAAVCIYVSNRIILIIP